ncbi:hypothetical protein FN846DRAFT_998012 [Sphaerosporella brunnea]|uniref:Uncharacterized protein n=1 Tax=Sphaerosporella brunnea TaxID=1250544 RepID=A0A5J5F5X1_9PEZI|nr:hypothetical protein FN846DRAFT_998012 [Sphaerosporella brunnea]
MYVQKTRIYTPSSCDVASVPAQFPDYDCQLEEQRLLSSSVGTAINSVTFYHTSRPTISHIFMSQQESESSPYDSITYEEAFHRSNKTYRTPRSSLDHCSSSAAIQSKLSAPEADSNGRRTQRKKGSSVATDPRLGWARQPGDGGPSFPEKPEIERIVQKIGQLELEIEKIKARLDEGGFSALERTREPETCMAQDEGTDDEEVFYECVEY